MNVHRKLIPAFLIALASLTATARAAEVIIRMAPPVPRHEVIVERPGPNHVWIPGFWRWSSGSYVWVGGRWGLPPHPHAAWVPGGYHHRHGGWVWREGHWH